MYNIDSALIIVSFLNISSFQIQQLTVTFTTPVSFWEKNDYEDEDDDDDNIDDDDNLFSDLDQSLKKIFQISFQPKWYMLEIFPKKKRPDLWSWSIVKHWSLS